MLEILIIEDEIIFQSIIRETVGKTFKTTFVSTGEEALKKMNQQQFHLIILDVYLPDWNGFDLCQRIKNDSKLAETPILFLTGASAEKDCIRGFYSGGDDYLTKPFSPLELLARVEARTRHYRTSKKWMDHFQVGKLRIASDIQKAFIKTGPDTEKDLYLTPIEFRILRILQKFGDKPVCREKLKEYVWGKDLNVGLRSVDKHVCTLRNKLGECAQYIQTIPQKGYCLSPDLPYGQLEANP